jgi:hypothetical protein
VIDIIIAPPSSPQIAAPKPPMPPAPPRLDCLDHQIVEAVGENGIYGAPVWAILSSVADAQNPKCRSEARSLRLELWQRLRRLLRAGLVFRFGRKYVTSVKLTASSDRLALQALQVECKRYEMELTEIVGGKEGFRSLFRGTKVEPLILAYLCTAVSILRDNKPTFTLIKILCTITVDEILPNKTWEVADALNESLHDTYLDPKRAFWRDFQIPKRSREHER